MASSRALNRKDMQQGAMDFRGASTGANKLMDSRHRCAALAPALCWCAGGVLVLPIAVLLLLCCRLARRLAPAPQQPALAPARFALLPACPSGGN